MEFLREKENALDKWCDSKRIGRDVENLRQLILVEEFLNCVPEEVRVHLSERKTDVSYKMATLADEYTLTHRKTKEILFMGSQGSRMKSSAQKENPRKRIEEPSKVAAEQWSALNVEKLDI